MYKIIGVGFALLVQLFRAMREASECGTSDKYESPRFFCIVTLSQTYLFHAETGRFIGNSILYIMMKDKKQNEELQSRREFFKKAAKGALPILGAIVLAGAPAIVKAAEKAPMGCNVGCMGSCSGSCRGTCTGNCYQKCSGSCRGTCQTGCTGCRGLNYSKY